LLPSSSLLPSPPLPPLLWLPMLPLLLQLVLVLWLWLLLVCTSRLLARWFVRIRLVLAFFSVCGTSL
jgi:hypothetical protein